MRELQASSWPTVIRRRSGQGGGGAGQLDGHRRRPGGGCWVGGGLGPGCWPRHRPTCGRPPGPRVPPTPSPHPAHPQGGGGCPGPPPPPAGAAPHRSWATSRLGGGGGPAHTGIGAPAVSRPRPGRRAGRGGGGSAEAGGSGRRAVATSTGSASGGQVGGEVVGRLGQDLGVGREAPRPHRLGGARQRAADQGSRGPDNAAGRAGAQVEPARSQAAVDPIARSASAPAAPWASTPASSLRPALARHDSRGPRPIDPSGTAPLIAYPHVRDGARGLSRDYSSSTKAVAWLGAWLSVGWEVGCVRYTDMADHWQHLDGLTRWRGPKWGAGSPGSRSIVATLRRRRRSGLPRSVTTWCIGRRGRSRSGPGCQNRLTWLSSTAGCGCPNAGVRGRSRREDGQEPPAPGPAAGR